MRLVQLRIRGFRRFQDLALDLGHDRVLVVGPNEAGKSSMMEAILAGLYGLSPSRRGGGHSAALRAVQPWSGAGAAVAVGLELDDGRRLEVDWDFTSEQTRVVDHGRGEDVTADFAPGTHGWIDVGERLLALPAGVFRQVTCVSEGQLASLSEETEIRQAVLRLTDSGVDVLVEEALSRLDDAARQATAPRSNSATRRNQLGRELAEVERALDAAGAARDELEQEVAAIRQTEVSLTTVATELTGLLAKKAAAEESALATRSGIDRARGRLAEAELRMAALGPEANRPGTEWSDEAVEEARRYLVTPPVVPAGISRQTVAGWALALAGALMIAVAILRSLALVGAAGMLVAGAGVYLLTRGRGLLVAHVEVAGRSFADRSHLMRALDEERARRDHLAQQGGVARLQRELAELQQAARGGDEELAGATRAAEARKAGLASLLERQRASYDRGASMVAELAPLEEQAEQLREAIARLDAHGAAAALGAATLRAAAEEMRRNYAPRLQQYLGRDLSRVTRGRYTEAMVSDRFEVLLRAPENGSLVPISQLSRGTQQQVYLLLRLGLLEVMGSSAEKLPMFLDDALVLADDARRAELLRVLEAEARQVIYFTAGEGGAAVFGPAWHRVVLPAPGSDDLDGRTGQLPMSLVNGPV